MAQIDSDTSLAVLARLEGALIHEFSIDGHAFAVVAPDESSPVSEAFGSILASFCAGDRCLQLVHCCPSASASVDASVGAMVPHSLSIGPEDGVASLLTARELQIVQLVADGHSNKLIARRLQISVWTVSSHLKKIFLKLGVDTRAQMVHVCTLKQVCSR